jgi:hypothetical protein
MPVLHTEPKAKFTVVAIVEGWGSADQDKELLTAIQRRACETGADALILVSDRMQIERSVLYDPNEPPVASGNASVEQNAGDEIIEKERMAPIGRVGHSGHYIDTYAIVLSERQ